MERTDPPPENALRALTGRPMGTSECSRWIPREGCAAAWEYPAFRAPISLRSSFRDAGPASAKEPHDAVVPSLGEVARPVGWHDANELLNGARQPGSSRPSARRTVSAEVSTASRCGFLDIFTRSSASAGFSPASARVPSKASKWSLSPGGGDNINNNNISTRVPTLGDAATEESATSTLSIHVSKRSSRSMRTTTYRDTYTESTYLRGPDR